MHSYQKRTEYTFEEKKAIVDYIISHNGYNGLRGNTFWQEMEDKQILQRTWQSVKEHFRKKIIDFIHTFQISEEEKRLFRDGWQQTQSKKSGNTRNVKRRRYDTGKNHSSDEDKGATSKIKSTQDNNNYEISDSDSSTHSLRPSKSKGKKILKSKNHKATRPRSPSEYNYFSDEDDEIRKSQSRTKQIMDDNSSEDYSPDLLGDFSEKPTALPSSSKIKNVSTNKINTKYNKSCLEIYSDSDDDTVIYVPVNKTGKKKMFTSNNNKKASNEEFSLAEDMELINFIKLEKFYLQRRNELEIYTYFHDIYPNSKSPKQLKDRFLNHIFPNICKYTDLTNEEMCQFYEDAGAGIPNNLKALLDKSPRIIQEINNDFQRNISENEINNSINCLYTHITLNGQSHMFVSNVDKNNNTKSFIELLSKKFKIAPEFIHNTEFLSIYIVDQMNKFRSSICKKFENIIAENLPKDDINIEEIFGGLEVCFQSISPNDVDETSSVSTDSSCESSDETKISQETVNTQNFNPMEISTPLSKEHSFGPFRVDPEIMKQEILVQREENLCALTNDHNYSAEIPHIEIKVEADLHFSSPSINLNQSFVPEQQETVYFDSDTTQIQIKLEPDLNFNNTTESLNQSLEIIEENQDVLHQQIEEKDSQFLEAIATQDSTDIRNAVARMVDNNFNNSIDLPTSEETYLTATNFSQDVR